MICKHIYIYLLYLNIKALFKKSTCYIAHMLYYLNLKVINIRSIY